MELTGTFDTLRTVTPILIALRTMLRDKDIGSFVASTDADYYRHKSVSNISLCLHWFAYKKPPFWKPQPDGKVIRSVCTVPNIKRSAMDYDRILFAMGGKNGYMWGRFWSAAMMDCGSFIKVYGSTAGAAETRLEAMLELTDSKMLAPSRGEEVIGGTRNRERNNYKESTRIYPAYISVVNINQIYRDERTGRRQHDGTFKRKQVKKLEMYLESKPNDFDDVIRQLLRRGDQ